MGERGVDLQRLACLALLLVLGQETQGAHVVQPVGELDDQRPRVAGHRDDHPADRLRLRRLRRLADLDPVELADGVDDEGDLVAEGLPDRLGGQGGLLQRVVQQGRGQRRGVHPEIGEDARHGDRVGDVRVAGEAHLAGVRGVGDLEGLLDLVDVGPRVVREQAAQHRIEGRGGGGPVRREARQAPAHPARQGWRLVAEPGNDRRAVIRRRGRRRRPGLPGRYPGRGLGGSPASPGSRAAGRPARGRPGHGGWIRGPGQTGQDAHHRPPTVAPSREPRRATTLRWSPALPLARAAPA